jgi:glycosyltransferase involved in cell wall biosynthesis
MGDKLRWAFFVDGMEFDGESVRTKALGGSETAGYYMAKEIAARGHDVTMFAKCPQEGIWDGVRYRHARFFQEWAGSEPHDVTVIQRVPGPFTIRLASPVHLWWMHDLALRRYQDGIRGVLWSVDKILTVSEWMRTQYIETYGLEPSVIQATRNGIDLNLIRSADGPLIREKLLVFTARPERGMDIFLGDVLPRIVKAVPDVAVVLAGYENYVQELAGLYNRIQQLVAQYGGRVRHVGGLPKLELYKLYKRAALYCYPTDFEEVSCITAMECAACGLPFVASHRAALPETCIPEASLLVPHDEKHGGARSPEFVERFANEVIALLKDGDKRTAMGEAGMRGADRYAWSGVAAEWEAMAYELMPALVRYE